MKYVLIGAGLITIVVFGLGPPAYSQYARPVEVPLAPAISAPTVIAPAPMAPSLAPTVITPPPPPPPLAAEPLRPVVAPCQPSDPRPGCPN